MVYLRVLGSFEADLGDVTVPLGGPRQRAVLALLVAARGRVVSVDRMIEDLWRGEPPARAVTSLQAYVSNLRRLLEPARPPRAPATILVSAPPGYALRLPDDAVDAWLFERLVRTAREHGHADPAGARSLVEQALNLWRGPAFAAAADEPWAVAEAARLEELHLTAREFAVSVGLRAGDVTGSVVEAERLTRNAPLREEGWRLHALALWAGNRQADALATLRAARAVLAAEVGLDPGPALLELEDAILNRRTEVLTAATRPPAADAAHGVDAAAPTNTMHSADRANPADPAKPLNPVNTVDPASPANPAHIADAATVTAATTPTAAPADESGPTATGPTATEPRPTGPAATELAPIPLAESETPHPASPDELFVGRDAELAALTALAGDVASGGLRIALVTGEAGQGKSTLLTRLGTDLRQAGMPVVTGRCPEADGAPPAWAWVEALRALAGTVPPPPESVGALAPLLDDDAGASGQDTSEGRFRLHRAVWSWLGSAARRRPLAILLDDLHRADGETLALLAFGAEGGPPGPPVLVVAAYRPDEAGERLTGTLAGLARTSPVRLSLNGLPDAAVARLVDAVARTPVDRATVTALAERTGGNPFYVRESARLLDSEGALVALSDVPEGVRDVLRRRLARLPDSAVAVLRLAAVAGREADVDVLVGAAEIDEAGVLDALDAALVSGFLTEPAPGRVRFVHALVRDTMCADLSGLRMTRMHARIAAALEQLGTDDVSALAHHHSRSLSAATAARAVEVCVRAAELAERRFAQSTAVDLLTHALECLARVPAGTPGDRDRERADLFGRLLRAQVRAGDVAGARATRRRALEAAEAAGRDDLSIAAFTAWTVPTPWQSQPYGQVDTAVVTTLGRLLARPDPDPAARALLLATYATESSGLPGGGSGDPRALAEEAVALADGLGDPGLRAHTLATLIRFLPDGLDATARASVASELVGVADEHDMPVHRWFGRFNLAAVASDSGDPRETRRLVTESLELARAYRMPEAIGVGECALAALAHIEGRWEEAERGYAAATAPMDEQGSLHAAGLRLIAIATIRMSQGRLGELASSAQEVLAGYGPFTADLVALALAADGRVDDARRARALAEPIRADFFRIPMSMFRASAVIALDERDEAAALYPTLLPLRDMPPACAGLSLALRPPAFTLGELARYLGRDAEAAGHFARAARIADTWGAEHWAAEAREAARRVTG